MGNGYFNLVNIESGFFTCKSVVSSFFGGTASGQCLHNISSVWWNDTASSFTYDGSKYQIYVQQPAGSSDTGTLGWNGGGGAGTFAGGGFFMPEEYYVEDYGTITYPAGVYYTGSFSFVSVVYSGGTATALRYTANSLVRKDNPNGEILNSFLVYRYTLDNVVYTDYVYNGQFINFPLNVAVSCSTWVNLSYLQPIDNSERYIYMPNF